MAKLDNIDLQTTLEDEVVTLRACARHSYDVLNAMLIGDELDAMQITSDVQGAISECRGARERLKGYYSTHPAVVTKYDAT